MNNKLIFELKDVYFSYLGRYPALCGIDITIRRGERITIIGANGSGKSTLLHMLDGLIFPDKGTVKAFGRELEETLFNDEGLVVRGSNPAVGSSTIRTSGSIINVDEPTAGL